MARKCLSWLKKPLDEVAFAIEREVARPLSLTVSLGWDDRSDAALGEGVDERVGVVCFVANQGIWVGVLDQWFRASKVMSLTRCEHQLDGIAQSVHERMNLGGQSAA